MEMANVLAKNSPFKVVAKAPKTETSLNVPKQPESNQQYENKQTPEMKNNNKAIASKSNIEVNNMESDDDDSVFINENKPKKANKTSAKSKGDAQAAACDASSVMLSSANASSSDIKPAAAQNPSSRDSNVKSETVVR